MGISCGQNGKLDCTDDDTIEITNLNRQFLFRKSHVQESKSLVACKVAKEINPGLQVQAHKARASEDNESLFTDDLWDREDIIVGAVDNVQARRYVDAKCLFHGKPLFDSGTLGTKCNSQITVPNKTEGWGDSIDQEETGVPMCTLRHYPYLMDHCIEWSRGVSFEDIITSGSNDFAQYMKDPQGYVSLKLKDRNLSDMSKKDMFKMIAMYLEVYQNGCSTQSMMDCGRQLFQDQFHDMIANLLHCFPADYIDKDGRRFWTSPKRPPTPLIFDNNDELHMTFVQSVVTIMKAVFGIKTQDSIESLKEMAKRSNPKVAVLKKIKIKENEEDNTEEGDAGDDDMKVLDDLADQLSQVVKGTFALEGVDFEKDDDSNGHIGYIYATSNLRARNYKIEEVDFQRVKFIAGKIIPAIATSTAMIVGAVGLEIIKHFAGVKIEKKKNSFHNLALPFFTFSETLPPKVNVDVEMDPILFCKVIAVPQNWTSWDKMDIAGPLTVRGMIEAMMEKYQLKVTMLILGAATVWANIMPKTNRR